MSMSTEFHRPDTEVVLDLGEGSNDSASVAVGQRVAIDVTSPGTTGYLWSLDADEDVCRVVSHEILRGTESFGGTGVVRFIVEAMRPGVAELPLRLQAPWEETPIREFEIRIDVSETQ
jgi:predicted secreted protein